MRVSSVAEELRQLNLRPFLVLLIDEPVVPACRRSPHAHYCCWVKKIEGATVALDHH